MTIVRKRLRRGLFDREQRLIDPEAASDEEWNAHWAEQKFGADLVANNLDAMSGIARYVLDASDMSESDSALAREVLVHVQVLKNHRRHNRMDEAIIEAMSATQRYVELVSNLSFEKLVAARRKQLAALPKRKPTVTDDQILLAIERFGNQEDAAAHLDISSRQVRNRLSAMKAKKPIPKARKRK